MYVYESDPDMKVPLINGPVYLKFIVLFFFVFFKQRDSTKRLQTIKKPLTIADVHIILPPASSNAVYQA